MVLQHTAVVWLCVLPSLRTGGCQLQDKYSWIPSSVPWCPLLAIWKHRLSMAAMVKQLLCPKVKSCKAKTYCRVMLRILACVRGCLLLSWQDRAFVKAPVADLLLPEDIVRGWIRESHPDGSVMERLLQAVQHWEAEGGEQQIGQPGLCRVMPIHRQIWELGHSTHICGILNVTPDSFSDGGKHVATAGTAAPVQQTQQQELQQQQQGVVTAADDKQQQQPPSEQQQAASSSNSTAQPGIPTAAAEQPGQPQPQSAPSTAYPASVRGSINVDVSAAVDSARAMARAGAQLIDVGGQSTRPGSARLTVEQELSRVIPVIRALREDSELVHIPVSIDTFHSRVAAEAIAAGADMINDVTGGQQDPNMFPTAALLGVPYCLMHFRGDLATMTQAANTTYSCVWGEVGDALRQRAQQAVQAGVLPWNLILDPGLGFSKTSEGNAQLLGNLQNMRREMLRGVWGRMPLLVGPSRKRFIGKLTGRHVPAERDLGTAAACVAAVAQGADIVRVHNVLVVAEALRVADGVFRGTWPIFDD
eukprot:GHUV01031384.1.p1 GENE.GHUV01031384.1~~GHUV01031384.1.p1  ORF type:complete len:532 (+),score=180.88 GHUV01031384.1:1189-2784(+)